MNLLAFILSLILPGLGQVLLSRYLKGIIFFFAIIILLDLSFVIFPYVLVVKNISLYYMLYAICSIIYLYNLWDIFNITYWRERKSLRERKKPTIKRAIVCYLKNDLEGAQKEFSKALKLDPDDIDIMVYLSNVKRTLGEPAKEKRLLNKVSLLDFTNKYRA